MIRSSHRGCRRPFTLVELLVVIAIISILAGMLLPALSRARSRAAATACISNEKQLSVMFLMYTDENEGWLPPASMYLTHTGSSVNHRWISYLDHQGFMKRPVVGQASIHSCPTWEPMTFVQPDFGYGVPNGAAGRSGGTVQVGNDASFGRRLDRLDRWDVILADSARAGLSGANSGRQWSYLDNSATGAEGTGANKSIHFRHSDFTRTHAALRDGHVEALPLSFVTDEASKRYYWTRRTSPN